MPEKPQSMKQHPKSQLELEEREAVKLLVDAEPIKRRHESATSNAPWIITVNLSPESHNVGTRFQASTLSTPSKRERDAIFAAAREIESVANIKFVFVEHYSLKEKADIFVSSGIISNPGNAAMTNRSRTKEIVFNQRSRITGYTNAGDGYRMALHELCHALGLGHPDGDAKSPQFNTDQTIMSYNLGDPNVSEYHLRNLDKAALRATYGSAKIDENMQNAIKIARDAVYQPARSQLEILSSPGYSLPIQNKGNSPKR